MKQGDRIRREILDAGLRLWRVGSEPNASRIASMIGVSRACVLYHFTNANHLRESLASYAVREGDSSVILQLIGIRHPSVSAMSETDCLTHIKNLSNTALTVS